MLLLFFLAQSKSQERAMFNLLLIYFRLAFWTVHSLSFTDLLESVKIIFITKAFDLIKVNLFNKIDYFLCYCAGRSCRSHKEIIQQVTNLQTVSIMNLVSLWYSGESPVWCSCFWQMGHANLQGQYFIYRTTVLTQQHPAQNSFIQHQQVVTKCKARTYKIYTKLFASEKHLSFQTSCRNETW